MSDTVEGVLSKTNKAKKIKKLTKIAKPLIKKITAAKAVVGTSIATTAATTVGVGASVKGSKLIIQHFVFKKKCKIIFKRIRIFCCYES